MGPRRCKCKERQWSLRYRGVTAGLRTSFPGGPGGTEDHRAREANPPVQLPRWCWREGRLAADWVDLRVRRGENWPRTELGWMLHRTISFCWEGKWSQQVDWNYAGNGSVTSVPKEITGRGDEQEATFQVRLPVTEGHMAEFITTVIKLWGQAVLSAQSTLSSPAPPASNLNSSAVTAGRNQGEANQRGLGILVGPL